MPDFFDARQHFTECTDVISRIGSQEFCGSCWAFATAHAISDRICIASKGKLKPSISAQDIMECTDNEHKPEIPEDGSDKRIILGNACRGGSEANAWQRYVDYGFVTGSTMKGSTAFGCKPYLFACGHQGESDYCPGGNGMKLSCERSCANIYYENGKKGGQEKYKADRYFGQDFTGLSAKDPENIEKIKRVLFTQGSVTAGMDADTIREPISFDNEEKILTQKGKEENHAIRIIGWGKSDKVGPYWLIANSYNSNWNGDGTIKIAFGAAFLAQLDPVYFAVPKLSAL